jgi:beta-glucosidase/6-phospho-beta-glucosidase/beta-galactosidase
VNYETQVRTPKDSAYFYSEVAATKGANLTERSAAVA